MTLYHLVVFLPLLGALFSGIAALLGCQQALYRLVSTFLLLGAASAAIAGFVSNFGADTVVYPLAAWFKIGGWQVDWALRIDAMSRLMMVVVTSVSAAVHVYSLGYMAHDEAPSRFFSYISFFTFMMLMLVTANDMVQLFFGWEGVGVASYLLIGFWYHKTSACAAAMKAFIVNRVGDAALILGLALTYKTFGSTQFDALLQGVPHALEATTLVPIWGESVSTLGLIGVLLFIGAMGKSAQIFLHTWLADAMEGPTPVSALIHAATMVTAGVFLTVRCSPLYSVLPNVSAFIAFVGATTALFAALTALVQNDIKKIIAYSTCSQLGYMFFAVGVGAYGAAMFHLFTHAFFKALLFLSAGSVIHGLHHEQDIRRMGALRSVLPVTFALCLIGTIAITGFGLPHVFGFAGFYSKDAILVAAAQGTGFAARYAFIIGLVGAALTSFYSWRLFWAVYAGAYRGDAHTRDHAHESPLTMLLPMIALAAAAIGAGWYFEPYFVGAAAEHFWGNSIVVAPEIDHHHLPVWLVWAPLVFAGSGLLASLVFLSKKRAPGAAYDSQWMVAKLLVNKFYFDEIYNALLVKPYRALASVAACVDKKVVDGFFARLWPATLNVMARGSTFLNNGAVDQYCLFILAGAGLVLFTALAALV